MNVQRLTLDLDKSSVPRGRVTIAQCDHDGTTVEAEIYDNGIAVDTSGLSAYLVMRLPDGKHYYRVPATLDGHVATALVDEAYAATATGTTEIAYFELVGSGGVVYSTSRFGVRVLPSATADATVPETWDGEVERLIQQLDEMAESSRVIIADLTTLEETVGAAERGRVSAESGRVSSETARANAESGRVSAEQGRVTAEQGRVTAESSRASEFSTLKSESQAATSAANTAAENADAATTATNSATQRAEAAIDAMGDISELAVPLMSADVRGGARLEEHGGLVLRDEKLGIGNLVQESDGYARGGLAEVTAEGHAEQFSTTGKNLFQAVVHKTTASGITFDWYDESSVHIYGTATATVGNPSSNSYGSSPITLSAGTYTLSGLVEPLNQVRIYKIISGSNPVHVITTDRSAKTGTFTLSETTTIYVFPVVNTGVTIDVTIHPQIELGSTATEYEPYTGAAPSPSPEFPQPIEVVSGRNLCPYIEGGMTYSAGDGSDIVSANHVRSPKVDVKGGTVYTISLIRQTYSSTLYVIQWDASGTFVRADSGDTFSVTLKTKENTRFLAFACGRVAYPVSIDTVSNPQIELGSTPQPYVPYGHVGMERIGPIASWEQGAISESDGNSYNEDKVSNETRIRVAELEHLEVGKSYRVAVSSGYEYCLQFFNENKLHDNTKYSGIANIWTSKALVFTAIVPYLALAIRKTSQANITPSEHEVLTFGVTTPIPLPSRGWVGSLPDGTADVLTLDGAGKVTWELPCWMSTYDGSEDWQREELSGDRGVNYYVAGQTAFAGPQYGNVMLCSHSLVAPEMRCIQGTIYLDRNVAMSFTYGDALGNISASEFKTWLASHNVTVLAHAATPITEDCGYVNMPSIDGECQISIPELDALGVRYFVDDSAGTLARQWYERAQSEYESRILALEQAVAELATA